MDPSAVLQDLYGRIRPLVASATEGLDAQQLATAPQPGANTVGWLVWHLTRVQDHHVAHLLEQDQLWVSAGWAERFGLDADPSDTGYGHDADQVAAVRPGDAAVLLGYYDAVVARTDAYLQGLSAADLDAIVDRRWDPPVTLGVRLVSVADDSLQHVGQAAYVKGLLGP